jgi:hypothetical protein
MNKRIRVGTAAVVAVVLLAGVLVACGAPEDTSGLPTLDPEIVATTLATGVLTPTVTAAPEDAWKARYTGDQLRAYDGALDRFTAYERDAEPVWARGRATPEAQRLFREYWMVWDDPWEQLKDYQHAKTDIEGIEKVLWSRAAKINLRGTKKTGRTPFIWIKQCVDPTTVTVHPAGEGHRRLRPYLRTVIMWMPPSSPGVFLIVGVQDITNQRRVAACEAY